VVQDQPPGLLLLGLRNVTAALHTLKYYLFMCFLPFCSLNASEMRRERPSNLTHAYFPPARPLLPPPILFLLLSIESKCY